MNIDNKECWIDIQQKISMSLLQKTLLNTNHLIFRIQNKSVLQILDLKYYEIYDFFKANIIGDKSRLVANLWHILFGE